MRLLNLPFICAALLITLMTVGCSGGPVVPGTGSGTDLSLPRSTSSGDVHHCLGYYTLVIDTENPSLDVLHARSGELHLNVVNVLNTTMGVSAVGVPSEHDPATGLFVFDITLTHPFGTKPQLAGFDVKGILMTPGSLEIGSLVFADADETRLENADGYTRWWNPTEFTAPGMFGYTQGTLANVSAGALTATINPYKYFADSLVATDTMQPVYIAAMDDDNGRGVFTAGSSNTRRYSIRFPMDPGPQVVFGYAVDAAWNMPSPNPPDAIPDDFPMAANEPEPYYINAAPSVNTLYYDSESGSGGGVYRLNINVHDWQGQQAGNISSEIDPVRIFAPDLFPVAADGNFVAEDSIRARYTTDLTGTAVPTEAGPTLLMIQAGSTDGSSYKQVGAPAPDITLSSYYAMVIEIPDPVCQADANNDWLESVPVTFEDPIIDQVCLPDDYRDFFHFDIPAGYEPTGELRLYCDAEPTTVGIYDDSQVLIAEDTVTAGIASIDFDSMEIWPGHYFIRVLTSNNSMTCPYVLEFTSGLQNQIPLNPVDVTPTDLYCDPIYVYKHGDYMYLAGYLGVWVYDVSDPANPVQVSYNRDYYVGWEACFNYPYMFVTDRPATNEGEVNMIDFTDPLNPVFHENVLYFPGYELEGICANSTHLYVGSDESPNSEVVIFEYASDPVAPVEVGTVSAIPGKPQLLELMDPEGPATRLVVGTWDDIYTYQVEDPANPQPTGAWIYATETPRSLAVEDPYIYVGYDVSGYGDGWLHVLRQNASPTISHVGSVDIPGNGHHLVLKHPYAYFADGVSGFTICEVTTPSAPSHISTTNLLSFGLDLAVENDIVYIIPWSAGLQIIDCSTPQTPAPLSRLPVVNSVYSMERTDDYLLVAEAGNQNYGAIKTVDISDPANVSLAAAHYPGDRPTQLSLDGNILAVNFYYKWGLFDASDPLNITPLYTKNEADDPTVLAAHNNVLYIAFNMPMMYTVYIYDITTPSAPSYEGSLAQTDAIRGFTFGPNHMYVITYASIEVYSLTNPLQPNHVDTYSYSVDGYNDAVVQGNYMYLCSREILEIADLSNPASPSYVGSTLFPVDGSNWYYTIAVDGQFGFMAGYSAPSHSALLWPPDSPSVVGPVYEDYSHSTRALYADGGYLFEGSGSIGLRIYDLY